jgi:predicted aldo/keto reductase-like oxidoreductase
MLLLCRAGEATQEKGDEGMAGKDVTRREFVRTSAVAATGVAAAVGTSRAAEVDKSKILNYNEKMEYRPLGKTGLTISAVCLGGHWKHIEAMVPGVLKNQSWLSADLNNDGFKKNRADVVTRCMEVGINYIDACTRAETLAYSAALKGRRDKMHLGYSWYEHELRNGAFRKADALLKCFEQGLKDCGLDYVDVWRITMHEQSSHHKKEEVEEMMKALEKAREQGKARFTGFSSHDRPHIQWMIETFPNIVQVVVTPYTAKTKELPKDSVFETFKKYGVGVFGIKPYASGSLFKGDGTPGSPHAEEDNRIARLTLRHVLCNPALTAPIPGMISVEQVDNAAKAVAERRELDAQEKADLERAADRAWANLPANYQWLKDWENV